MENKKDPTEKKPTSKTTNSKKDKNDTADNDAISSADIPDDIKDYLKNTSIPKGFKKSKQISLEELRSRLIELNLKPKTSRKKLLRTINLIKPSTKPVDKMPKELPSSIRAMRSSFRRFHGARMSMPWFPLTGVLSKCANRFGYISTKKTRDDTKLPFNVTTQALLGQLGGLMGDPLRETNPNSNNPTDDNVSIIPAGYTYFGQFVDHDITLDISSTLDSEINATKILNMRTPCLDLDSVYGRGPGLDPFLYEFPTAGPATAIKLKLGMNRDVGPGGPSSTGAPGGMVTLSDFDVPRMMGTNTAIIGDPRNDENLIVSQLHHAMLRFHNAVVDLLLAASFSGDIFAEAKRIVIHHYQWAVVHDFLIRICGNATVNDALTNVKAPVGSAFKMPVEFAVAAYRFGHSMVRNVYWVNFNFINASLGQVFEFIRNPRLPVFSNWVVDFNAFFDTGISVPVNNKARTIDTFMATGLESLPGFSGLMAILATRNLRRGLALGLPSGQGMADTYGITPMTEAELTSGLLADEIAVLNSNSKLLLKKTPLWYYVLREAAVLGGGNQLGPVGGRIVAETFVRILKRDAGSFLNVSGGFSPILPSAMPGEFTVADLLNFAGVTQP